MNQADINKLKQKLNEKITSELTKIVDLSNFDDKLRNNVENNQKKFINAISKSVVEWLVENLASLQIDALSLQNIDQALVGSQEIAAISDRVRALDVRLSRLE